MFDDFSSPVTRILREEDALVITWNDGARGVFPHTWLRDNALESRGFYGGECQDSWSGHCQALIPWSVTIEYDETLVISWAGLWDVNRFSLDVLRNSEPVIESPELALAAD